jgi:hypothetical protein
MGCIKAQVFIIGVVLLFTGFPGCILGTVALVSVFVPGQYKE